MRTSTNDEQSAAEAILPPGEQQPALGNGRRRFLGMGRARLSIGRRRRRRKSQRKLAAAADDNGQSPSGCQMVDVDLSRSALDDDDSAAVADAGDDARRKSCSGGKNQKANNRDCPICYSRQPVDCFPALSYCAHRACHACMVQYLQLQISESRVNLFCPECNEPLHPNDVYRILADRPDVVAKYEEFSVRRVLMTDPDTRWCPAPDCGYAVIASGCAACPELRCQRVDCGASFCYHCKMLWHSNQTCDEARAKRRSVISSPVEIDVSVKPTDIKACPRCRTYIVKMNDGSCNHMVCALCGAEFCWLCLKEISDLHYLSPSGCTFWGKKPWSRKKKLFWQIGMLVGAPVGIAVVSSLAIPAIVFGFPVWVGRKLHQRAKYAKRCRRLAAVSSGVLTSILVGPFLAVLAVSVGVPILLAYIYGVVLVSLCRDGSCGIVSDPSSVKLSLDETLLLSSTSPAGVAPTTTSNNGASDFGNVEKTLLLNNNNIDEEDEGVPVVADSRLRHQLMTADVRYSRSGGGGGEGAAEMTYFDKRSLRTMTSITEGSSMQDGASLKGLSGSIAGCCGRSIEAAAAASQSASSSSLMEVNHDGASSSCRHLESRVSCFMDDCSVDQDESAGLLSRLKKKCRLSRQSSSQCSQTAGAAAAPNDYWSKGRMAEFLVLPADAVITNKPVVADRRRLSRTRTMLSSLMDVVYDRRAASTAQYGGLRSDRCAKCQSGDLTNSASTSSSYRGGGSGGGWWNGGEPWSRSMPDVRRHGADCRCALCRPGPAAV